jgi:hypothetical protein
VERYVSQCTTCNKAKSQLNLYGLYMHLLVSNVTCEDISMYFILGFLKTKGGGRVFLWLSIVSLK